MGEIYYPVAGVTIISLISLVVTLAPTTVQDVTQGAVNTSQLQTSTDVGSPAANATVDTTSLVGQASSLVDVLTNPNSGNRLLSIIFTGIGVGLVAWIIVVLIPG